MTETEIKLNVHEVGVILSALQLLSNRDENLIAKEYGSAAALYNKMHAVWGTDGQFRNWHTRRRGAVILTLYYGGNQGKTNV